MDIKISEEIEGKFREKAMREKGYRKGALKEAMEEAIRQWLNER